MNINKLSQMELGLLLLAIVVFLWWYDNLYEFVSTKHTTNPTWLVHSKG